MIDIDIQIEKLLEQLTSDDWSTVKAALKSLANLKNERAITILLDLLEETDNPSLRNAIAIELSDAKEERAKIALFKLLRNPKTDGSRGTLIYALEEFDCSEEIELLVDTVIGGKFEASFQAFEVIEAISQPIESNKLAVALTKIEQAVAANHGEKKNMLKYLGEVVRRKETK